MRNMDDEKTEVPEPETSRDWRATLGEALDLAEKDPEAFAEQAKILAKRFGLTVEQVYDRVQSDPEIQKMQLGKRLLRGVIRAGARRIRREIEPFDSEKGDGEES